MAISDINNRSATALTDRSVATDPQQQPAPKLSRDAPDKAKAALREHLRPFASATPIDDGHASVERRPAAAANATASGHSVEAAAAPGDVPAAKPTRASDAEVTQLLNVYEPKASDATNVQKLTKLELLVRRGTPFAAAQFEALQQSVSAKIADLPPRDQDYYRGAQAVFINKYEAANTQESRGDVALKFGSFMETLDNAHSEYMSNPSWRLLRYFDPPIGIQDLNKQGQAKAAGLERYRNAFNAAKNTGQREAAFKGAAALKADLQQQIGNAIGQVAEKMQADHKQADQTILDALNFAKGITDNGDANTTLPFVKLSTFAGRVFTSADNTQAFKAMQQEHPEQLAELGNWAREAADKTLRALKEEEPGELRKLMDQARKSGGQWVADLLDVLTIHPAPTLPGVPKGFLDVDESRIPLAHYGDLLLDAYQNASIDISNASQLYHAATERGPINDAYLRAHTPPPSETAQEVTEVLGRLLLAPIPGVNLLTDAIVPRSHMSDNTRKAVDIAGAFLGAGVEGAIGKVGNRFPSYSEANRGQPRPRGRNRNAGRERRDRRVGQHEGTTIGRSSETGRGASRGAANW